MPLHRLNTPQTKLWLFGGDIKRRMASNLAKIYKSGVGVCSATLHLIAHVDGRGNFRDLAPPHRRYEMHDVSNKPHINECQCAQYFDPESQGAWRDRPNKEREHHPYCQFDRTAMRVFTHMLNVTPGREAVAVDGQGRVQFRETRAPAVRPDEALRARVALK